MGFGVEATGFDVEAAGFDVAVFAVVADLVVDGVSAADSLFVVGFTVDAVICLDDVDCEVKLDEVATLLEEEAASCFDVDDTAADVTEAEMEALDDS